MHLGDPVPQTVLDHPPHDRLVGVQRVAAPAVVVIPRSVVLEDVVDVVGQAPIAERRSVGSAFGGVIEDHVEDDFDARAMQRLHHVAEFVEHGQRLRARAVGAMRCEERDWLVAPVVHAPRGASFEIELKHRQQLDGRHAQVSEIGNLLDQSGIRAPLPAATPELGWRVKPRYVQLVDHGLGERTLELHVAVPVVARRDRQRRFFIGVCGVVARPAGGRAVVGVRHRDGETVRIEQHFLAVESKTAIRREGAGGPVRIGLTGLETGTRRRASSGRSGDAADRAQSRVIGRAAFLSSKSRRSIVRGALREHAEIDASRTDGRAKRSARRQTRTAHRVMSAPAGAAPSPSRCRGSSRWIERSEENAPTRAHVEDRHARPVFPGCDRRR